MSNISRIIFELLELSWTAEIVSNDTETLLLKIAEKTLNKIEAIENCWNYIRWSIKIEIVLSDTEICWNFLKIDEKLNKIKSN